MASRLVAGPLEKKDNHMLPQWQSSWVKMSMKKWPKKRYTSCNDIVMSLPVSNKYVPKESVQCFTASKISFNVPISHNLLVDPCVYLFRYSGTYVDFYAVLYILTPFFLIPI